AGARDLRTYSLGFASEDDRALDELPLAQALARRYGTEHHELVVEARTLLDDLLAMVWSLDEPYGGGLPSWYVFRFMSEDVKVGLTGSGGDELFGNYGRFAPFEGRLARLARAPGPVVRAATLAGRLALPGLSDRANAGLGRLAEVRRRPVRWHYFDLAY